MNRESKKQVLTDGGVVDSEGTEAGGITPNGWLEPGIRSRSKNGKNIIDCLLDKFIPYWLDI